MTDKTSSFHTPSSDVFILVFVHQHQTIDAHTEVFFFFSRFVHLQPHQTLDATQDFSYPLSVQLQPCDSRNKNISPSKSEATASFVHHGTFKRHKLGNRKKNHKLMPLVSSRPEEFECGIGVVLWKNSMPHGLENGLR
jgi:hypothetical protein